MQQHSQLLRLILVLFFAAMSYLTPCENYWCLWRVRKTTILAEVMCAVCKMMGGKTKTYFKHNSIDIKQMCHKLFPNLVLIAQHGQGDRNEPIPQVDEDQENRRPK
jgi:hypothetical protein